MRGVCSKRERMVGSWSYDNFHDTPVELLSYVEGEGRVKFESPVLCTQPVRPWFCMSSLTFLRAARVSWVLTS